MLGNTCIMWQNDDGGISLVSMESGGSEVFDSDDSAQELIEWLI